jgi:pSer/pThr/pTyr-binding forkhead associated (FHA) protein
VNQDRVLFCHSCGHKLSNESPPAPRFARDESSSLSPVAASANPGGAIQARLIVIRQDGSPGRSYEINAPQVDIGLSEGDILLANDPYVSPRHARLFWRNGKFVVRDLDSVNGVYVRVQRPCPLHDGDLVLIGLEVLRFELVRGLEAGLGTAMERGTQLFGSPATPRYARLCQMTVEGVARDVFYLGRNETTIGRESGDIVFTADPFMSRRHAAISRATDGRTFMLNDLGSSNGTYVAIRSEAELNHGDHIRIGQHLFRLEVEPRPVS